MHLTLKIFFIEVNRRKFSPPKIIFSEKRMNIHVIWNSLQKRCTWDFPPHHYHLASFPPRDTHKLLLLIHFNLISIIFLYFCEMTADASKENLSATTFHEITLGKTCKKSRWKFLRTEKKEDEEFFSIVGVLRWRST